MKKFLSIITSAILVTSLAGCGGATNSADGSNTVNKDNITIGIAQFAEHPSLENCREGFIQGLAEAGYKEGENLTIDYKNAEADMSIANQVAQSMASGKNDLICAIATPMAQAVYNAAQPKNIPVVYTAVTDPVAAQLAKEDGTGVGKITGTSDKLAVDAQLKMIREFLPDAKKIGILYSTSETNSVSAIAEYKELAPKYNFEIVDKGISQPSDIPMAANDLASKVDCISNLTDNTVVSSLPTLLDAAKKAGIPVFGSEIEQVKNGCVATEGLDYVALGKQTGEMAAKVLAGEDPQNIPFETISEYSLYINSAALKELNMECPADLASSAIEAK